MQLMRMFSTANAKGTQNYLDSQRKYELLRTLLYFFIPIALFIAGMMQTEAGIQPDKRGFALFLAGLKDSESRGNLLSIVAVLGLLPASKSLVSMVMFLRFHSFKGEGARRAGEAGEGLAVLYDCVFTSYKKNFVVGHLAVRGNTVCGYSEQESFDENAFYRHIDEHLKMDGHKAVTVKVFTDLDKYAERLRQMRVLEEEPEKTAAVIATLKSVML